MSPFVRFAAAGTLVLATAVTAQPLAVDATQPTAPAPPLRYVSALDGYKPLGDTPAGNWRAVNERVREAAAQRAQAAQAAPVPAPPTSSAPPAGRPPSAAPAPGGAK